MTAAHVVDIGSCWNMNGNACDLLMDVCVYARLDMSESAYMHMWNRLLFCSHKSCCEDLYYLHINIDTYRLLLLSALAQVCVHTTHFLRNCRRQQFAAKVCIIDTYTDDFWSARACMKVYALLHLKFRSISFSNLNLFGLLSTERGNKDEEN